MSRILPYLICEKESDIQLSNVPTLQDAKLIRGSASCHTHDGVTMQSCVEPIVCFKVFIQLSIRFEGGNFSLIRPRKLLREINEHMLLHACQANYGNKRDTFIKREPHVLVRCSLKKCPIYSHSWPDAPDSSSYVLLRA